LANAASLLAGFPVSLEDSREVTLGACGPKSAGGAMNLKFSCIDGAGHCQLRVTIEADYGSREFQAERVEMLCAFEPAELDQFVNQLHELNSSLVGSAALMLL
jgi:hypothetical protein